MIDSEDVPDGATEYFVECLAAPQPLHPRDFSMQNGQITRSFATTRGNGKRNFNSSRSGHSSCPTAHRLLRFRSNVEDLTRCSVEPDRDFVESLAAGGLNNVRKFSILYRGGTDTRSMRDVSSGRVFFVSRSLSMR